ncbi:sodium channel subunit beta-4 isoform X2 [Myripristis murdjan]|uniref:sodium channel subunit beta-4 isoform X2 n=1 Tax=Myripristis murdjan TaxID=586833 RepID=UPI00117605BE|nr:sodium channel subunit beta-4-like isoform X2 [Myripristis murdjan]
MGNEDKLVVISAVSGQDIILPCYCPNPVDVQWQVEFSNSSPVVIYNETTSDFTESYKKRAEIFLAKNNTDCSLLLSDVTLGDQGKYECYFGKPLTTRYVTLNVSDVSYHQMQDPATKADGLQASVIIPSVTAASVLLLVVSFITYKRLRAKRENTDNFII